MAHDAAGIKSTDTTADTARLQKRMGMKDHVEKTNVDSILQIQLKDDRGSSARKSWKHVVFGVLFFILHKSSKQVVQGLLLPATEKVPHKIRKSQ